MGGLGLSSPSLELPFEAPTHACIPHPACRLPDRVARVCPSAGPDVNPALVQQQKQQEEAAAAKETSCSKHPAQMSTDYGVYVNCSFEHPAKSVGGLESSPSENRQKF